MIIDMKPLSLAEVNEQIKNLEETKELKDYLKTFGNLDKAKSEALIEELKALDNIKLKEIDMKKISDFIPKNAEELNKIFNDISLEEKEINDILEITKKY